MKKIAYGIVFLCLGVLSFFLFKTESKELSQTKTIITPIKTEKKSKKSIEEKYQASQDRFEYELNLQRDPATGEIPKEERALELQISLDQLNILESARVSENVYITRGPSNLGGRTRSVVIDLSDPTGNTMLAGGVSSGVFRTTNAGASWTKVSPNNAIHNATAIAQDPRPGFQNRWYYATGEFIPNVSNNISIGGLVVGQGLWESTNGGVTWTQIPGTDSTFEVFDSFFDVTYDLAVSPVTGDLFIASFGRIHRYDGTDFIVELQEPGNNGGPTDVEIDSNGRVYAALRGNSGTGSNGVYTSETGDGTWVRISQNGDPAGWASVGRIVISTAPSNENFLYALYANGANSGANQVEADLWRYDLSTDTWTDFSSRLPNLPGGPIGGINPFAIQIGYDLDINVKPDDENYVVIAGTSAYRIENIETDPTFEIIGGYDPQLIAQNQSGIYTTPNGDIHHPDVHDLVFNPFDPNTLFTGTDGGVHRTDDVNAPEVDWVNLNNDYLTYQYYDVFLDQLEGSDFVLGGAQDNGTTAGGVSVGLPDNSTMTSIFGGDGVSVGIGRNAANNIIGYFGGQLGFIARQNFTTGAGAGITPAGATNSLFVTLFHLDPDNNNALYYANGGQLFATTNAETITSGTWNNLGFLPGAQTLRSFATTRGAYDPATSYLLIGGQNGGIFRLDDPQNATTLGAAVNITPPGASTAPGTIVNAMAIHPTNPDIAMVTYANYNIPSIYITSNATSANPDWILVERNIEPNSIRAAQILVVDGQVQYYVGTARGLYSNPDPENRDWSLEGGSTIGIPVISDLEYRPSDNTLLIGTLGNGMFATDATLLATDDFSGLAGANNDLSVFPNPVSNQLNFEVGNTFNPISEFQIIDYAGRVIEVGNLEDTQGSIDVSNYSTGIYFINVRRQNNETTVSKFIKR